MLKTLSGLYAITDSTLIPAHLFEKAIAAAISGGVRIIQYRDKSTDTDRRKQQAQKLLNLCNTANIICLINDDINLAKEIGADGVHIGQDDTNLNRARSMLGPKAIIGVSCYNDLSAAITAQQQGADYVAFGRFFSSSTKPDAPPASLEVLQQAHNTLNIPICTIGGITPTNAPPLLQSGSDMLAVISGIFGTQDISQAAKNYADLFN